MTTTTATEVFCPDWCTLPMADHLAELNDPTSGGTCRHESALQGFASYAECPYPDGSPSGGPAVLFRETPDWRKVTPDVLRTMAAGLRAAGPRYVAASG
jgi:hypothetical protein